MDKKTKLELSRYTLSQYLKDVLGGEAAFKKYSKFAFDMLLFTREPTKEELDFIDSLKGKLNTTKVVDYIKTIVEDGLVLTSGNSKYTAHKIVVESYKSSSQRLKVTNLKTNDTYQIRLPSEYMDRFNAIEDLRVGVQGPVYVYVNPNDLSNTDVAFTYLDVCNMLSGVTEIMIPMTLPDCVTGVSNDDVHECIKRTLTLWKEAKHDHFSMLCLGMVLSDSCKDSISNICLHYAIELDVNVALM